MQSTKKESEAWREAHNHIYHALAFMPREWPIFADVEDGGPCPEPQGTFLEAGWHHRRRTYQDLSAAIGSPS